MSYEEWRRRLAQVVEELQQEGWSLVVEPREKELPPELSGSQPDFIARKADELLVGEVASRTSAAQERIDLIARQVPRIRNARFVVYWLGDAHAEEPAVTAILKFIDESSAVSSASPRAGFLTAWAALEAAITRFSIGKSQDRRGRTPRQQLSSLYSLGYISEDDHERLVALWRVRSEIAHRATLITPSQDDIDFVLSIAKRMATKRYVSVDEMVEWFFAHYKQVPAAPGEEDQPSPTLSSAVRVLSARFPEASMRDIEAATNLIEQRGVNWTKREANGASSNTREEEPPV